MQSREISRKGVDEMAVDGKVRNLPKGIRYRDGKYEQRCMYRGKSYSVRGNTIGETKKAMTKLKYELENGLHREKSNLVLNDWFDTWMDTYKKNSLKRETFLGYYYFYNKHVRVTPLGNMLLTNIRAEHIQKLYNDLVAADYSFSTIKQVKATVYGSLEQAVRNEIIEKNPVKLVNLPRVDKEQSRVVMTKEQQSLFMKYAKDSYLNNLFETMLRTGMRVGEVQGLKTSDIDERKKVINVVRTLKYERGYGFYESTPKTKTSIRDIPLTIATKEILNKQRKYWSSKTESKNRYLFTDEVGEPLQRERIRTEMRRIMRVIHRDGYDFPNVTPHTFRHTFATRAIEYGMQPQILKTILGHASLAMTMDLYSHVLPETRADAMELIAGAF
jgi:integrase